MTGSKMIELSRASKVATPLPTMDDAVSLLQVVADPIRWTVLQRLSCASSCVCDLQEHVPIAANLLSYHLKVLREAGLITGTRRGRWIDYAVAPDAHARIAAALPTTTAGELP